MHPSTEEAKRDASPTIFVRFGVTCDCGVANSATPELLISLSGFGGRNRARIFVLAFAPGERLRISRRPHAQQWVIRRSNAVWQYQGIEIDVTRGTGVVALDMVDRQYSDVDLLAIWRPRNCRVIGRISRLTYSDYQMPLERMAANARNQRIK